MEQDILEYAAAMHCQELHMTVDEHTKLKAVIAIHSTALGPALGGCRLIEYPSTDAAVVDAIRLAQGMTYKAAMADLSLGGGKMVILKPKEIHNRNEFFRAVGRFVNTLNGRYITAVDSGTSVEDMDIVSTETKHVTSTSHGTLTFADPSLLTAHGVLRGIQAAVKYKLKKDNLQNIHVAIQGVGHAGYPLAKELHAAGAKLTVFDIKHESMQRCVKEFNAKTVSDLDSLISLECDVFAPCALGAILNDRTIAHLKAPIVAGCANNQLEEPRHGSLLLHHGILYAPDYVINAGGLIYVAAQYGLTEQEANEKIENLYHTLMSIFERSTKEGIATNEIADLIAREKVKHKLSQSKAYTEQSII